MSVLLIGNMNGKAGGDAVNGMVGKWESQRGFYRNFVFQFA